MLEHFQHINLEALTWTADIVVMMKMNRNIILKISFIFSHFTIYQIENQFGIRAQCSYVYSNETNRYYQYFNIFFSLISCIWVAFEIPFLSFDSKKKERLYSNENLCLSETRLLPFLSKIKAPMDVCSHFFFICSTSAFNGTIQLPFKCWIVI